MARCDCDSNFEPISEYAPEPSLDGCLDDESIELTDEYTILVPFGVRFRFEVLD